MKRVHTLDSLLAMFMILDDLPRLLLEDVDSRLLLVSWRSVEWTFLQS